MQNKLELAEKLLQRFKGREGVVAVSEGKGFRPITKTLTPDDWVRAHDKGIALGLYLLRPDGTVDCSAIDIDDHGKDSEAIQKGVMVAKMLKQEAGIEPLIEISQSGTGCHCWLFHPNAPAGLVRDFWRAVLQRADISAEVYPKQDSLETTEKGYGSLIRYPLHGHSRFVNDELQVLDPLTVLDSIDETPIHELRKTYEWWVEDQVVVPDTGPLIDGLPARVSRLLDADPTSTLAVRWLGDGSGMSDSSGSALAMAIAVELVRGLIPTQEIEQAITFWGEQNKYEKARRPDWVKRTVARAYDYAVGKRVSTKVSTFASMSHRVADLVHTGQERLFRTGIENLDKSLRGGIAPSEMTVVCARTSNGKSTLTLNLLDTLAANDLPGTLFSLEMSSIENGRRILSKIVGDISKVKTGAGIKEAHQEINEHFSQRAPIYFEEDAFHIDDICRIARQHHQQYGIQAIAVDYAGLCVSNHREEYASQTEVARKLKRLAKELDIALIACVQLNRGSNGYDNPLKPRLKDLRASGEWENSADNVFAAVWPWKEQPSNYPDKSYYEIHVLKCRNRGIQEPVVQVYFDHERQRFM